VQGVINSCAAHEPEVRRLSTKRHDIIGFLNKTGLSLSWGKRASATHKKEARARPLRRLQFPKCPPTLSKRTVLFFCPVVNLLSSPSSPFWPAQEPLLQALRDGRRRTFNLWLFRLSRIESTMRASRYSQLERRSHLSANHLCVNFQALAMVRLGWSQGATEGTE